MKTLVIHPKDSTTDFLKTCYAGLLKDTEVVTKDKTKQEISDLIESHERLIMMGHGSPNGLFSVRQFPLDGNYIIDYSLLGLLELKKDNVYIWCNADCFVKLHQLKGFFTGMFISEEQEAWYCGFSGIGQEAVDESNSEFCRIMAKYISESGKVIYENVKKEYALLAKTNPIAKFNLERLYCN